MSRVHQENVPEFQNQLEHVTGHTKGVILKANGMWGRMCDFVCHFFSRTKIRTKIARINNSDNFVPAKEKMLSLGFSSRFGYKTSSGYITKKTVWSGRTGNFFSSLRNKEMRFVHVCRFFESCRFSHIWSKTLLVARLSVRRPPTAQHLATKQ